VSRQIKANLPKSLDQRPSRGDHTQSSRGQNETERPGTRNSQSRCAAACGKVVQHDLAIRHAVGQCQNCRLACIKFRCEHWRGNRGGRYHGQPNRLPDGYCRRIVASLGPDLRDHSVRGDNVGTAKSQQVKLARFTEKDHHYDRRGHLLVQITSGAEGADWIGRVPSLRLVSGGALLWLIVGDAGRVARKYGERADRFLLLEAGHLMQNLCLLSVSVGLVTLPLGGVLEREVARALRLPAHDLVLYAGVCGHPTSEPAREL